MTMRAHRITNGQRAAVCGLMLCGVPLWKACEIVAAPIKRVRELLPPDWLHKHQPLKWRGHAIDGLEECYFDRHIKLETTCELFGIGLSTIYKIARREDWPTRRELARRWRKVKPRASAESLSRHEEAA